MKDICKRLSAGTGLDFKISNDTCEPYARGDALNYWVTTWKDGFTLEANSIHDYVFCGKFGTESELIDKIISLENSYK